MEKHNLKTLTIAALSLLFFLSLAVQPSASETTFNWKWSPQVAFRLPAYNTVIAFNDYIYMNSFTWDNFNATSITFNNICFQGEAETAPHFTVSLKNANMTIQHLLHNKQFIAELNGVTGTVAELAITNSLYQSMPVSVSVAGVQSKTPCPTKFAFDSYNGDAWYYDTATNTVYVKATLHSPTSIIIDWESILPPQVPPVLTVIFGNFWLALTLFAVFPVVAGAIMVWKGLIGDRNLTLNDVIDIVVFSTVLLVVVIVIAALANAIL
jgi:hypothetical protein